MLLPLRAVFPFLLFPPPKKAAAPPNIPPIVLSTGAFNVVTIFLTLLGIPPTPIRDAKNPNKTGIILAKACSIIIAITAGAPSQMAFKVSKIACTKSLISSRFSTKKEITSKIILAILAIPDAGFIIPISQLIPALTISTIAISIKPLRKIFFISSKEDLMNSQTPDIPSLIKVLKKVKINFTPGCRPEMKSRASSPKDPIKSLANPRIPPRPPLTLPKMFCTESGKVSTASTPSLIKVIITSGPASTTNLTKSQR